MELKDNFTNRYFKPDQFKSQIDMIKEPTATDTLAEGFQRYGNLPANNAYAQLDNMTMASIGDGMKAVANDKRKEQLDPILKMTGEINARAAYLEAQMQEQQQETMQTQQFVKDQGFSFMELSKAATAGDTGAANNIARGILQSYKYTSGDPIIGDFDHYHDGNIYYTNAETGEKGALNIPLLLNKSGIAPELFGADYGIMMSSYSPGFKGQYENAQEMQRLALDKERAGINQTKAHTGLYEAQTGKTVQEIQNPPMNQEQQLQQKLESDIRKDRAAKNYTTLEKEILPRMQANESMLSVYESLDNILIENPAIVGSDLKTRARRTLASAFGLEPDLDYAKLKSVEFEKMLRPVLGAQIGEKEGERLLSKFASLDNNPQSLRTFLDNEMPKIARNIIKDKNIIELYDKENYANLFTPSLDDELDYKTNSYLNDRKVGQQQINLNSNMIVAQDPDTGVKMMIPIEKIEEAKSRGLIINE